MYVSAKSARTGVTTSTVAKPHLVIGALIFVWLLASLDQSTVSVALPAIVEDLDSFSHLSWVVTAYLLAGLVTAPIYGKLGDLIGRKRILQFCIATFIVGSLLCGLSQELWQLIVFRTLQGIGAGGLFVTVMATVADIAEQRKRAGYQGMLTATFGLATVAGPLIGGYCVENLSWHWVFFVNVPVGLLAYGVISLQLPLTHEGMRPHRIDFAGGALLSIALTLTILLVTTHGAPELAGIPVFEPVLLLAMVCGLAFLFIEFRANEPILPPGLFRVRNFAIASAVGFLLGIAYLGVVPFLPLYLQDIFGPSTAQAGMKLMPVLVSMAATALVVGRVINRYGYHKPFPVIGTLIMGIALVAIARFSPTTDVGFVVLALGLLGIGMGMVSQILVLFAQDSVRHQDIGVATSSIAMFRTIGSVVGAAIFGAKLAALPALSSAEAGPLAIAAALRSGLGLAVAAAVIACLLACAFREIKER